MAENDFIKKRIICFEDSAGASEFDAAFTKLLQIWHRSLTSSMLPKENVHRYNHGSNWDGPPRGGGPEVTMRTLSATWELPWQALVENDLSVIVKSAEPVVKEMDRQFAEMMYGAVGAAAEKVGNVVDAKSHASLSEAFAAGLEKVSFGVKRTGEVSLPEFHMGSDAHGKLIAALESQPPEFKERIDKIIASKSEVALAEETARKQRFKGIASA